MSDTDNKRLLLDKVHLKGFKSIKDLKLDLKPGLNILIGKNGSGKSNFLEFLNDSVKSIYSARDSGFKYADFLFANSGRNIFEYEIERIQQKSVDSNFLPESLYKQKLYLNKQLVFDSTDDTFVNEVTVDDKILMVSRGIHYVFSKLDYRLIFPIFIRYDLPKQMLGIDAPGEVSVDIRGDFEFDIKFKTGFLSAAFSDFVKAFYKEFFTPPYDLSDENEIYEYEVDLEKFDASYLLSIVKLDQDIIDNLATFTPIKNLRINENVNFSRLYNQLIFENIRIEFFVNDQWLPWSQLSDGTRRLFYIVSELTNHSDGVVLLEEPELGIHPHQFHLLMQFIKEQAEEKQIIISTHSPKALDILNPEQLDAILIATYDKDKGTQINRMTPDQESVAKEYMKEMFLSDYWLLSDLEGDD